MRLQDRESHCINLYSLLMELGYNNSADWFRVASGIKKVEFDGMVRDSSFMMCRPAYEYELERNKLHNKIVNQIVTFNFIWSGLESLIYEMKLRRCPSRSGKINEACFYLKSEFDPLNFELRYFGHLASKLYDHVKATKSAELLDRFKLSECVSKAGIPLNVIYKLRNHFAHGVFNFPEPSDWNGGLSDPKHEELINRSTILILMSVQMLLIGRYRDSGVRVSCPYEAGFFEGDEEDMPLFDYLKVLHIEKEEGDFNPDQVLLEIT